MKGSLFVLCSFIIGVVVGFYHLLPNILDEGDYTIYVLAFLLFLLGISIGHDKSIFSTLRRSKPIILLVPLATVIGTWIGTALVSIFFTEYSVFEVMAVGSGFGYYSLSSIFITEYKGVELGTIALAANIIRELSTMFMAPFLVAYFGKLAPIAAGGSTSLDSTLPVITRTSGTEYIFIAMFHGIILDLSIPFIVTFLCQI